MHDEWFTRNIRYTSQSGYIMLQLPRLNLPPQLTYGGVIFEAKTELHVSLLTTKKLAEYFKNPDEANERLVKHVRSFLRHAPVVFEQFSSDLYHCKYKDVQTIIVGAKLRGVQELFSSLHQAFPELINIPDPALHVTLYKYNHKFGIGIQSHAQLQQLCLLVPKSELVELRRNIV